MLAASLLPALLLFSFDGGIGPGALSVDAGAEQDAIAAHAASTVDGGVPEKPATAPPQAALRKLSGKIVARGTRQPLAGAQISFAVGDGTRASTESAADGSFSIEALPGTHQLRVQYPAFVPLVRSVDLHGDVVDLVLRLEPRPDGERYETVVISEAPEEPLFAIKKEELIHTAGSFGDPFRVIESLPGVAQSTWPLPFYAIRGANPGNTGFFIDGVRAPALFHFALGPSVIHPFFIEDLAFYPGGYPVNYSRYVSGIVAANTATPATDRLHVSADVRLFDVGGIVAAPFDNGKGTLAVAGRYSYTGLLLSAFSNAYSLDYWDYQVRVQHTLGPGKLTLFAFGSGDRLEQKDPDQTDWGFPGQKNSAQPGLAKLTFHRAQLRWDGVALAGHFSAAVVGGIDDSTVTLTSLFSLPVGARMYTLAPRLSERWTVARWMDVEIGADSEIQRARPRSIVADVGGVTDAIYHTDLFRDRAIVSAGGYVGIGIHAGDRFVLSPGLRYDGYFEQGTQAFALGPRLLARYRVGPHDWVKATVGQFSQMPSLPVGVPGFESFGLASYGLQRSRQASVGVESALVDRFGLDLNLDTSLFYQRLHLTDLRDTLIPDPESADLLEPREGESYGLEVTLRRPMKHRLYGWVAYTLSRSLRLVDGIVVPSDWDQRHILNLVVGYRWPRNFSTSARFHYNSGRPYPLYSNRTFEVEEYIRMPPFPQLDLRGDKRFIFDKFIMDVYLELVNSTLSREVYDVKRQDSGALSESYYRLVLPSAGVHIEW